MIPSWVSSWCYQQIDWKVIARYKHSRLFGLVFCNEEKMFYNFDTRSFGYSLATSVNWAFNLLVSMTFLSLTELMTKHVSKRHWKGHHYFEQWMFINQTKLISFENFGETYTPPYGLWPTHQGILKGEVSLYPWPPVWLVWISLFCK
jgi:hypothetical protein